LHELEAPWRRRVDELQAYLEKLRRNRQPGEPIV